MCVCVRVCVCEGVCEGVYVCVCVCACVCVCSCTTPNFCRAAESIDQVLDKLLEYVDDVIVSQTVCG